MHLPHVKIEQELALKGVEIIIGVDEAGRGPLAGPVVAGAVWVNSGLLELEFVDRELIRDSKALSQKQREKIYSFLAKNKLFTIGIGEVSHAMVDRMNILNAALLAMRIAVEDLLDKIKNLNLGPASTQRGELVTRRVKNSKLNENFKTHLLIDGNKRIPKVDLEQHLFPKGDRDIFSIAAASICAKVHRDRIMQQYHEQFPEYGFASHKGYGTRFHMEQLQKNGPCKIHRRSFRPVRELT